MTFLLLALAMELRDFNSFIKAVSYKLGTKHYSNRILRTLIGKCSGNGPSTKIGFVYIRSLRSSGVPLRKRNTDYHHLLVGSYFLSRRNLRALTGSYGF